MHVPAMQVAETQATVMQAAVANEVFRTLLTDPAEFRSGVADRHWNTWRAFINGEEMISQRPASIIDPLRGDVDDSFFKILPGGAWGATVRLYVRCR